MTTPDAWGGPPLEDVFCFVWVLLFDGTIAFFFKLSSACVFKEKLLKSKTAKKLRLFKTSSGFCLALKNLLVVQNFKIILFDLAF